MIGQANTPGRTHFKWPLANASYHSGGLLCGMLVPMTSQDLQQSMVPYTWDLRRTNGPRDWIEFFAAFATFFGSHSLPLRPTIRAGLTKILGRAYFLVAYSGVSLVTLYWLMSAASRAPYLELWPYASWQNYVPIIAMVASAACLAFSLFRPNPFSFGGTNNSQFFPSHPGIVRWFRHPLLAALFIWAIAHLVPNGNLAHLLVFGSFALFSLLGMYLIDFRRKRELGDTKFQICAPVAISVGAGVSVAGPIGFAGLVAPHTGAQLPRLCLN